MISFKIFYFLITPIFIYNIWSYFRLRFGQSTKSIYKNLFICTLSYILITYFYIFIEIPVLTLLINHFCFFLISRLFIKDLFRQLSEGLLLSVILVIIELLIATLINFYTINYQDASTYQSITAVTLVYLIEYVFIKYLHRRNYQSLHHNKHTFLYAVQFIMPLVTIIIFLFFIRINLSGTAFMIFSLFSLLTNIVLFELYDALAKSFDLLTEEQNFKQEQLEYANQLKLIETHSEEWEHFRHDLKNRLTPLYGFIDRYPDTELKNIIVNIVPEELKNHQ